jgi:hypothetical protein
MAVEKYIAAAGLGLFIMFSGEIITIYNFMQDVPTETGTFILEPDPKILQFISIGAAPAVIMAGVSFIMVKRHGSKPIGIMIIAGGAIMLIGMIIAHSLVGGIDPTYKSEFIPIITPLFIVVSIPVMFVGSLLLKEKKRRPKKEYV